MIRHAGTENDRARQSEADAGREPPGNPAGPLAFQGFLWYNQSPRKKALQPPCGGRKAN